MTTNKTTIAIRQGYRLQWETVQDAHVLLYPEGMIKLSPSAAEILTLCTGEYDEDGIISALQAKFPGADLAADVREFLEVAYGNGWIANS
jgi:pyrroloquinoline quinone biosynthesis protein D